MSSDRHEDLKRLNSELDEDFSTNLEAFKVNPSQINARNLLRSGCAYIEFIINSLSDIIPEGDILRSVAISEFDSEFLKDRILYVDDNGEKKSKRSNLSVTARLFRKIDILSSVLGSGEAEFPSQDKIKYLFGRRNGLMHPKSASDVMVSYEDCISCIQLVVDFLKLRSFLTSRFIEISEIARPFIGDFISHLQGYRPKE